MRTIGQRAGVAMCTAALFLAGCGPGPSAPAPNTLAFNTTMSNAAGQATILDVDVALDGDQVYDSCPPAYQSDNTDSNGNITTTCTAPPVATVALGGSFGVGTGTQTITFFLSRQTAGTNSPLTYTVAAFTATVYGPKGVLKTFMLPAKTANIASGGSINYTISI
jgi:hypothetical protein